MRSGMHRCVVLPALVATATAIAASGFQTPTNSSTDLPQPALVLYHFIRGAAHVSRRADELDRTDGTGRSLREAFSSTIGLNDSDSAAVFALALALDAQFAALDLQAATAIANTKKTTTVDGLLPPPPAVLQVLQQQKTALMNTLGSRMSQGLSAEAKAAIAAHLHRLSVRAGGQTSSQSANDSPVGGNQ